MKNITSFITTSAHVDWHTIRVKYIYNHENANKVGEICKKKKKKEIVLNHDIITNNLTLYIFMIHDGTTQKSFFKNMFNSNDFERKCLRICF